MNRLADKYIRGMFERELYDISSHALDRMNEREITIEQVIDCVLKGEVIEIQDFFQDVHVLFQENSNSPQIYVIIAASVPPLIVTVCRTKEEVWEECNGILKRRKRCSKNV